MSLDDYFLQKLRQLPPDKQREVIDFVEFLHKKTASSKTPRRSVKGLWADLGLDVTEQDIAEARMECWSSFPRECT